MGACEIPSALRAVTPRGCGTEAAYPSWGSRDGPLRESSLSKAKRCALPVACGA